MEIEIGFQNTEVGIIPNDWDVRRISDVISNFQNGNGFSSTGYRKSGIPIVTMAQIGLDGSFQYDESKVNYWDENKFDNLKNYQLKNGDVIIAMTDVTPEKNLIGRMAVVKSDRTLLLNQRVGLLRIDEKKVNPIFLTAFSNTRIWRQYSIAVSSLGVQANIGTKDIVNGFIPYPSVKEQTAIATALNDADKHISELEKLIDKKRNIRQGATQELLRPKEVWDLKTLEEVVDCLDNLRVPLNETHRLKMKGYYPYCGANGILDYLNEYKMEDNVILIAEDGGHFDEYRTRPIAYRMKGRFWVNNHAHILKTKGNWNQDFIFYSLVHKDILRFLASGTRAKLNKSEMNKIEINLPKTNDEQEHIANILGDIDSELESLEKKLEKHKMIKQGMMQKLLIGKIRLV